MGGSDSKQAAMPHEGSAHFSKLEEDITCSVCLQELSDPVSITCGHTFCKPCISSYWGTQQTLGYRCPECRRICPRDQLIPAYRLQNMVTKVQLSVKEQQSKMAAAHPLQLVYTDSQNQMHLDDSAVDRCFLDSEISDHHLCLICVIGEKRKGKSTLLNYIVRALNCLEKHQPVSLGGHDEPLNGFAWRTGTDNVTKGIWMWSKPFILERNGEKMAVFVLDTEGSLDIESRETCIKLSALSMLLSSYLIFNVNGNLKSTELDYLEMYLQVSELTGQSFSLQYLQHLSILIRDWHDPDKCGREAAKSYIEHETERLRRSGNNHRVLETLRSPAMSSFLLPYPGKSFLKSTQARLADMDEDFRSHLTTYISDLVGGLWLHCKTDIHGERIKCGHLGQTLKDFVSTLQREHLSFSSPVEMFYELENLKNMKNTIKKFQDFLEKEAPMTSSPFKILGMKPAKMRTKVSEEATCLQNEYEQGLSGSNVASKQKLLEELKTLLDQEVETFCAQYSKRFIKCAVGVGCAVGGGVLSLAGGIAGAAVVGTVLATEAVALLGSTTAAMLTGAVGGGVTLGAIGTGVGAGVGGAIGRKEEKKVQKTDGSTDDSELTMEDTQQLVPKKE